jgi:3-methylfumaryl-CoA hydratase
MIEPEMKSGEVPAAVECRQVLAFETLTRIAAMLDLSDQEWGVGTAIPAGWHFALLGAATSRTDLRADGFPGLGVAMPKAGGKRLVALGRTFRQSSPLLVEQELQRTSRIAAIRSKQAPNGEINIVTVAHVISDFWSGETLIEEEQTFLLTNAPFVIAAVESVELPHPVVRTITPDETMLFQFSALSFNSHKIHVDRAYAQAEGYPDLVVNGGLTTLLMTEIVRETLGRRISRMTVRNIAPLFCNRPIQFAVAQQQHLQLIIAYDDNGRPAAEMEFETNEH